jgi:DNA-binding transcriptional LysR family regulator
MAGAHFAPFALLRQSRNANTVHSISIFGKAGGSAMAKLDLDWLGVFVEVYQTQSVSRGAERLGIAQASASLTLGKLRKHFGDPLFVRTSQGMAATPRAAEIYPELRAALASIAKARGARAAFDPAQARRTFRISMTDISEIVLLPRLVNHLQRTAPGLCLEAEKFSAESRRGLESGELDLAVGFTPALDAGFYQQALFAQNFVCLAAREHPRVQGKLTRRAFSAEGHIVVAASGTGHAIVDKVLAKHRLARRAVLRVPSFLGVARIVAQTELLVIVPRLLGNALALQEKVQMLEPPVALPNYKVKQHWHERFNADAGNVWLRRTMAALFAEPFAEHRPGTAR